MVEHKTIGSKVKVGYLWTLLGSGLGQPISFLFGIVLARALSPTDFGIIAACLLFTEIGSTLVGSSYVSGLVQKRHVSDIDLSTIFILQVITGFVVALIIILIAPIASHLLDNKVVHPVLSALTINLIILGFCGTPVAIARRNLNFRLLSILELFETIIFGIISIILALSGYGVWSLVIGKLSSRFLYALILHKTVGWRPKLRFSRESVNVLFKISAQFAGKNILDDLTKNLDYFIVGKFLGITALGFYARAYDLMTIPVNKLSRSLGSVLFPAFSKIQNDPNRLIRGLLKSTCLISITIFPILIGLQLTAYDLIPFVYGEKWLPTVLPLQIICFAGLFYTIDSPAVSLINAKGLLVDEIKRQLIHMILLVFAVLLGSRWGIVGVTWGVVFAAFIYWILLLQLLKKRMNLLIQDYLESLYPSVLACFVMALSFLGVHKILILYMPNHNILILIACIAFSATVYIFTLYISRKYLKNPVFDNSYEEIENVLSRVHLYTQRVINHKKI